MRGYCHPSIPYAMHYGYCRTTGTAIALYYSPCTVGTVTCVGATIALYCGLCTAGIATCMGTVIAYTILPYVWVLPSLHAVCYPLWVLPHA